MARLASNNNKAEGPFTQPVTSPSLVYYVNGKKYYYPLIKPTGSFRYSSFIFSYDRSAGDTFGIALNNTKYVMPNVRRPIAAAYDIPAGTYSPSTFQNLIKSFISNNGSRTVSNSFSVTVNGQTLSIASGTRVWYVTQGSSPWYARAVCFGTSWFQAASCQSDNGFSTYKAYIVETSPSNSYTSSICFNLIFRDYAYYNITVSTGIKFK